jgi:peroxiredoxin
MSRLRSVKSFLALFLLAFGCVCVVACATTEDPKLAAMDEGDFTPVIEGIDMLEVGDKAPLFKVSDVYGNQFSLADRIGNNVIVLVFWSIYCDPCRNSMPSYNALHRKYRGKGLDFLTVNMDGEEMSTAIRAYLTDDNIELPVLLDEPEGDFLKIADPYGVQGTPTIYIIDRKGRISFGKVGTVSFDNLSSLVKHEIKKK